MTWEMMHIDEEQMEQLQGTYGNRSTTAVIEPAPGQEVKHNLVLVDSKEGPVIFYGPEMRNAVGETIAAFNKKRAGLE